MRVLTWLFRGILLLIGTNVAHAQDCSGWTPIGDPEPRSNVAMAFDSARGVTVMYGGRIIDTGFARQFADTWEHDGTKWRFRTDAGPDIRTNHVMAFDSRRNVTVLYGGDSAAGNTWEWDGTTWTNPTRVGPTTSPRYSMTFDSARGVCLLYGGISAASGPTDEFWQYDGTAWRQIPRAGTWPAAATNPLLTFDSARGIAVLTLAQFGQIWEWNGVEWRLAANVGSGLASVGVFDPVRQSTLYFGNSAATWDGTSYTTFATTSRPQVSTPTITFDSRRGATLIYGGVVTVNGVSRSSGNLYDLEGATWTLHAMRPRPLSRLYPCTAFDPLRSVLTLVDLSNSSSAQTWQLHGETWTRLNLTTPSFTPSNQTCPMVADPAQNQVVFPFTNHSYTFDGTRWSFISHPNIPTTGSEPVTDTDGSRALLVNLNGVVWQWRGDHWDMTVPQSPSWMLSPLNDGFGVTFDNSHRLTVFESMFFGTLEGTAWSFLTTNPSSFMRRFGPRIVYSPEYGGIIQMGGGGIEPGDSSGLPHGTWRLNGDTWERIATGGAGGREWHAMYYDPIARRILVYGGNDNVNAFTDTWKYAAGPASVALQPRADHALLQRPITLNLIASGGGTIDYQWRKHGVPLSDFSHITGTLTDTLTILAADFADSGNYDCVVSNPCGLDTSIPVHVMVTCPADLDDGSGTGSPDGGVTIDDLMYFLNAYASGNVAADLDNGSSTGTPDGGVTIDDLLYFLQRFDAGC